MPELREEFVVKAPLPRTWALLSNMEALGLCVPGCQKVSQISEDSYDWLLQVKVLHTSRVVSARTQAIEKNPPVHVSFTVHGELKEGFSIYKIAAEGVMDLESLAEGETRVTFAGKVNSSGLGGSLINKIAAGQMKGLLQDFERNVKAKLETLP